MNFDEKLKELEKICNELVDKIDELKKEKQEAEKPKNRFWMPVSDEKYFSITTHYNISEYKSYDRKELSDNIRQSAANCYRESEKELAEKDAKRMQARQIIQRVADQLHGERYEFEKNQYNACICYMNGYLTSGRSTKINEGNIYFRTRELAEQCLELCEEEYKILLVVE